MDKSNPPTDRGAAISRHDAQALLNGNYPMQDNARNVRVSATLEEAALWNKARELAETVVALHEENARLKRRFNNPTYLKETMTNITLWRIDYDTADENHQSTKPTHSLHNIEYEWHKLTSRGIWPRLMAKEGDDEWRQVPWALVRWHVAVDDGNRIIRVGPFLDLEEAKTVLHTFDQLQRQSDDERGSVWIEAMDPEGGSHEMEYDDLRDSEEFVFLDQEKSQYPVEVFGGYALHVSLLR